MRGKVRLIFDIPSSAFGDSDKGLMVNDVDSIERAINALKEVLKDRSFMEPVQFLKDAEVWKGGSCL